MSADSKCSLLHQEHNEISKHKRGFDLESVECGAFFLMGCFLIFVGVRDHIRYSVSLQPFQKFLYRA